MAEGRVTVESHGDAVVVVLEGEFDVSNVSEVTQEVVRSVRNEASGVVMDLSAVRYIDSAGIRMMFELADSLATCRQRMVLCLGDRSPIQRLIKITNLDLVAPPFASLGEALDGLRSKR